jgi:uncharacterized protein YecE (DUF72 family)
VTTLLTAQPSIPAHDLRHPHQHFRLPLPTPERTLLSREAALGEVAGVLRAALDTVELNNSFYRLPDASAFDYWREATPSNFLLAVKGSRFITHKLRS